MQEVKCVYHQPQCEFVYSLEELTFPDIYMVKMVRFAAALCSIICIV